MPQTYMRAVGPVAAGVSAPVLVSWSRTGPPRPGRTGRDGAGQRFTPSRLPGAAGATARTPSEGRPGDGRAATAGARMPARGQRASDSVERALSLSRGEQTEQALPQCPRPAEIRRQLPEDV